MQENIITTDVFKGLLKQQNDSIGKINDKINSFELTSKQMQSKNDQNNTTLTSHVKSIGNLNTLIWDHSSKNQKEHFKESYYRTRNDTKNEDRIDHIGDTIKGLYDQVHTLINKLIPVFDSIAKNHPNSDIKTAKTNLTNLRQEVFAKKEKFNKEYAENKAKSIETWEAAHERVERIVNETTPSPESSTTKYLTKHGDTALDTLYRKNLSNMKGGTRYTIPILPMPQSNRQKLVTGIELVGKNLVVNYTDNSKTQIDLSNIVGSITAPSINTTAIQQIATGLLASLQTKFTELSRNLENKGSSELSNLKTNIAQIKQDIRDQLKTELSGTNITQEQLTALDVKLQDYFKNQIKDIKVVKEIKVVN